VQTDGGRFLDPESTAEFNVFVEHSDLEKVSIYVPELMTLEVEGVCRQATGHQAGACPSHLLNGGFQNRDMIASLIHPSVDLPMGMLASSSIPNQLVAGGFGSQRQADIAPMRVLRERALAGLGLSGCTTVMIRHISTTFTQKDLMQELCTCGCAGVFDFIYVPGDSRRRKNRGIGFVNFTSKKAASEFYKQFHGAKSTQLSNGKEISVTPADLQGYEKNAERFAREYSAHEEVLNPPILLRAYSSVGTGTSLPQTQPQLGHDVQCLQ